MHFSSFVAILPNISFLERISEECGIKWQEISDWLFDRLFSVPIFPAHFSPFAYLSNNISSCVQGALKSNPNKG